MEGRDHVQGTRDSARQKYHHGSLGAAKKKITMLYQTRPVQTDISKWKTFFKRMRKLHTRCTLKCFVIPAVDRTLVVNNSPEGGEFPLSVTWSTCRRLRRLGVSLTSHSNRLPGNVWRHHIALNPLQVLCITMQNREQCAVSCILLPALESNADTFTLTVFPYPICIISWGVWIHTSKNWAE